MLTNVTNDLPTDASGTFHLWARDFRRRIGVNRPLSREGMTRWAPPMIWGLMILGFSGDVLGMPHTSRFIVPLLRWMFPEASPETILWLHGLVRKFGHLVEYGIFAALWFRAFRWGAPHAWDWRWVIRPLAIVVPWAMVDEYRQTWTATRSGTFGDVVLDAAGAAMTLGLLTLVARRRLSRSTGVRPSPASAGRTSDGDH